MANQQKQGQSTPLERKTAAEQLASARQDWTSHFGIAEVSDSEVYVLNDAGGKPAKGAVNAVLTVAVADLTTHAPKIQEWLKSFRKKGVALALTILVRGLSLPQGLGWDRKEKAWHGFRAALEKICGTVSGPETEVPQFNVITAKNCGVTGDRIAPKYWQGQGFGIGLNYPVPLERNAGQLHTLTCNDFGPAAQDDMDMIMSAFLSGLTLAQPSILEACDSARPTEVAPSEPDVDFSGYFD